AGAVQITTEDHPRLGIGDSNIPISAAEIGEHIAGLRADPVGWVMPGAPNGYFSLAGAQAKFARPRDTDGSWSIPGGAAPSTHILKPGVDGLDRSALTEHLSLAAAAKLGLNAAHSELLDFDGERAIVSTRFDRVA